MDEQNANEFEQLLRSLTTDQLRFVVARQQCSSDADAARSINVSKSTICNWGEPVQQAVKMMAMDGVIVARERMRRALADAITVKLDGLKSKNDNVKQSAATELIDRVLGKATQKQEVTGANGDPIKFIIERDNGQTD
jgi:hypothetical protein